MVVFTHEIQRGYDKSGAGTGQRVGMSCRCVGGHVRPWCKVVGMTQEQAITACKQRGVDNVRAVECPGWCMFLSWVGFGTTHVREILVGAGANWESALADADNRKRLGMDKQ